MAKVILVASGKGGVGKSTVSALLGQALAAAGHKTLLAELDSGLRSLDVALGVAESVAFDMGDIARGTPPEQTLLDCPFCPGLSVICAGAEPSSVSEETLAAVTKELSEKYEFILLDCPAGLGEVLALAAKYAAAAILVTTPDPPPCVLRQIPVCFLKKTGCAPAGLL